MSIEPVVAPRRQSNHEGLRRVVKALAGRLPAVDMLPLIAQEACTSLDAATVVVALIEDGDFLRFRAASGDRSHELQGVRVRSSDSVAERALRTGSPEIVSEDSDSPQSRQLDSHDDPSIASAILPSSPLVAVAPIIRDGSVVGALLAMNGDATPLFTEVDLDLLTLFADHSAAALASDESERWRADQQRELSVLYRATRSVGTSLNLQEILDSVLSAICDHLDFQTAVVFLANDEQTHLFVAAERGLAEQDQEIQLSTETAPISETIASGQPRILTRAEDLPELEVFIRDDRIRAAMVAPILSRAECHGVILVTSPQPENFTKNDLQLLGAVAANAGIAISNAWLYEDATQRAENAGALYDLSQQLNATLNAENICSLAVDSVLSLLNADTAAILLYNDRSGQLAGRFARGLHAESLLEYRALPGEGLPGWVYEWETPQAVAHVAADARNVSAPLDQYGISSVLSAPMATGEVVLGVLLATTSHRRLFTVGEMELLYTVANQAAAALSNADLLGQARARAGELRRHFRRVARALGDTVQGEDVPRLFANLALAMMRGSVCNIYSVEDGALILQASASDRSITVDERIPVGEGFAGSVVRRGQNVAVDDLSTESRPDLPSWTSRHRFASYLGVPIRAGREVKGVVEIFTHDQHSNLREAARMLAQFARLARVAERLPVSLQSPDVTS